MKKILLVIISVSILIVPMNAMAAVKAGDTCKKAGSTATANGKKFTCIKSGKKLVWNKGIAIAKPKPTTTQRAFSPITSVSAVTTAPKDMTRINSQHSFFSGGMDPNFVTLGPKLGSRPELGTYDGKSGVNFEIPYAMPILSPVDAKFIGFNNRNSDFRNGMDGTLQVPFDDLEICLQSTSKDWPGMIICFYHLSNSPFLLGLNIDPLCSNAKEWPGPMRADGWQYYTDNEMLAPTNELSKACKGLLGKTVKRGDVIAYSGTVGPHSQAPIKVKVPNPAVNPTVKSGDKNLHWVQSDLFFYWKCFSPTTKFEPGVLAYPWECDGYRASEEQRSKEFKYKP